MTTDPFTEAARAEAELRYIENDPDYPDRERAIARTAAFAVGAVWARTHLAAQEPTDDEVEADARVIHEHFPRKYMDEFGFVRNARWDDLEPHMQEEYRVIARAALSAARAARRDEETP